MDADHLNLMIAHVAGPHLVDCTIIPSFEAETRDSPLFTLPFPSFSLLTSDSVVHSHFASSPFPPKTPFYPCCHPISSSFSLSLLSQCLQQVFQIGFVSLTHLILIHLNLQPQFLHRHLQDYLQVFVHQWLLPQIR